MAMLKTKFHHQEDGSAILIIPAHQPDAVRIHVEAPANDFLKHISVEIPTEAMRKRAKAYSRLIDAAPELLEALKALVGAIALGDALVKYPPDALCAYCDTPLSPNHSDACALEVAHRAIAATEEAS
jgi:hypothetical protein